MRTPAVLSSLCTRQIASGSWCSTTYSTTRRWAWVSGTVHGGVRGLLQDNSCRGCLKLQPCPLRRSSADCTVQCTYAEDISCKKATILFGCMRNALRQKAVQTALILACVFTAVGGSVCQSADQGLLQWINSQGGKVSNMCAQNKRLFNQRCRINGCAKHAQADVAICTNAAGVRGAFAVTAHRAGEVVAKVFARDSVELASFDDFTAAVRLHMCSAIDCHDVR